MTEVEKDIEMTTEVEKDIEMMTEVERDIEMTIEVERDIEMTKEGKNVITDIIINHHLKKRVIEMMMSNQIKCQAL